MVQNLNINTISVGIAACFNKQLCEDSYAFTSRDSNTLVISDGCSSSHQSFAASSLSSRVFLNNDLNSKNVVNLKFYSDQLGIAPYSTVVKACKNVAGFTEVSCIGDGYVGWSVGNEFFLLEKHYSGKEIPLYPIYSLDPQQALQRIEDIENSSKKLEDTNFPPTYLEKIHIFNVENNKYTLKRTVSREYEVTTSYIEHKNLEPFNIYEPNVFIATDGLSKIYDYTNNSYLSLEQVLDIVNPLGFTINDYTYYERKINVLKYKKHIFKDDICFAGIL
jgi:hypothetical protein